MFFNGKTNSGTERVISRSRRFRIVSTGAFCALAILTLLAVFPIAKHKEDAEATTVPATTSLSIISSKDTASVDITPTSKDGTFAISAAADQAEFSVTTDNLTGYSVTLLGSDTSGQLVNNITGDTLDTITSNTTESDFRTGSASTYANKWGYRLNVNNTTTTDFMAAPTTNTAKTIYSTNAPNTTGTSDNFTLALGARVDYEKQTGTYTNTFVLTAVGNPISYQIDYIDNYDGTATVLEQDAQSNITASEFIISATNPTRSGAIFKGWCYGTIDHTTNPSTCTGTTYQSGDTFTFTSIPSTGTATAELYAIWEMGDTMQSFTPEMCRTRAASGNYTLRDSRDGNEYTVRWINGECWMTQNLVFQGTTLNPNDSDVTTTRTMTYKDLMSASGECDGNNSSTSGAGYTNTCIYYKASDSYNSGRPNAWYNFAAVTAGTIAGASGNAEATESICPKGWKLPTSTQYSNLISYAGSTVSVFEPVWGGHINDHVLKVPESSAGYWASSTGDTIYRPIGWYRDTFTVNSGGYRAAGYNTRCVMRQTMQKFSSQDAATMATNAIRSLEDERDGQVYTVRKLSDGNVWMIRNLAIGCDGVGSTYGSGYSAKTLTSADSNVSTDYTTSTTTLAGRDNSYNNDYITCASYGALYNYVAASAGTITGSSNTTKAEASVCPKGWRLPTDAEATSAANNAGSFSPYKGGYYAGGNYYNTYGIYWSSVASTVEGRYIIQYNGSTTTVATNSDGRGDGFSVRCIKSYEDVPVMQNISQSELDSLMPNTGDTAMLKDSRDGNNYKVSKLADGNIYMLDNLALDLTDTNVQTNLTSATTNATDAHLTSLKANVSTSWADSFDTPKINTAYRNTSVTNYGSGNGKVGVYYNFCATSAASYCYSSSASGLTDATEDICPAGWRIPSGGASGEYQGLYAAYGSNQANLKAALSTTLSGYYQANTIYFQNSWGWFPSSTFYGNAPYMYDLYVGTSSVDPLNKSQRIYGFTVRCVKDDNRTVDDITYMQQMNPQIAAKMSDGDTKTLIDARDGQEYTTAKLNGNLWMTRNLAIGCDGTGATYGSNISSKLLTSADSNVSSNWSTPTASLSNGATYTEPYMTCSSTYGAYYNYPAVTVGTITGSSNTNNDVYNICPVGWTLPSSTIVSTIGNDTTTYVAAFNAVAGSGGVYYNGSIPSSYNGYGGWWSSTAEGGNARKTLIYKPSDGFLNNQGYGTYAATLTYEHGIHVRCVAK